MFQRLQGIPKFVQKSRLLKFPKLKDVHLKELLSSSIVAIFLRISSIISVYLFVFVLSKLYGPGGMGLYSFAYTVLLVFAVFGKLGFDTLLVRDIARDHREGNWNRIRQLRKMIFRASFWFSFLILGIALFFLSSILDYLGKEELNHGMFIIWLTLPVAVILGLQAESFRGLKDIKMFSLLQNNNIFLGALLSLFALYLIFPGNIQNVLWSLFIGHLLVMILSFLAWRNKVRGYRSEIEAEKIPFRGLLNSSIPMLLANVSFFLMMWTDKIMLGFMDTQVNLGIYEVSVRIASLTTFPLVAINSVVAPKIAQFYQEGDKAGMKKFSQQTTWLIMLVTLPVIVVIFFFPSFLLGLFGTGNEYLPGRESLLVLTAGQIFNSVTGPVLYILNMTGKEKVSRNILLGAGGINLVLNFILIPLFGITGAAISTAITTLCWNVLAFWFVYRYFGFSTIGLK